MPPASPRLELIKMLVRELGESAVAELEASMVMHRPIPDKLLIAIGKAKFHSGLTVRERQVMVLAAAGFGRQETARELGLSAETVKTYRSTAYIKLDAHNIIQAVNNFLDHAA